MLHATFVPHIEWSASTCRCWSAILGTTISPYLFFWQAAQEVEEERATGRTTVAQRKGATDEELRDARTDVMTGMFFSNFVMYFIILTTAATLHAHGMTHIATAKQAAEALRPLAGAAPTGCSALGLIGTGMLGVPVLAGSCAYAIAEAMAWARIARAQAALAPKFYGVLAVAMVLGLALDYRGPRCGEDAVLVGGGERSAGAAADRAGGAADHRPLRDGRPCESAAAHWLGWVAAVVMTGGRRRRCSLAG